MSQRTSTSYAIAASLLALLLFAASLAGAAVCLELAEPAPASVHLVLPEQDGGAADDCEHDVLLAAGAPKAEEVKPQLGLMQAPPKLSHALDDFPVDVTRGPPIPGNKGPLFLQTRRLRI